eukprot:192657-Rhodomonas_salina.5
MQTLEIANMVVAHIPCPPLPMIGVNEESGEETMFNSHSRFSANLTNVWKRCDVEVQTRYTDYIQSSVEVLANKLKCSLTTGSDYDIFCDFMRGILKVHPLMGPDIRFYPLSHVSKGDSVHRAAVDHVRSQTVLFSLSDDFTCGSDSEYSTIVKVYGDRIRVDT